MGEGLIDAAWVHNLDARCHQPSDSKTHSHAVILIGLNRCRLWCARLDQKAIVLFDSFDSHALQFGNHSADTIGFLLTDEANAPDSDRALGERSNRRQRLRRVADLRHINIDAPQSTSALDFDEIVGDGDVVVDLTGVGDGALVGDGPPVVDDAVEVVGDGAVVGDGVVVGDVVVVGDGGVVVDGDGDSDDCVDDVDQCDDEWQR